MAEEKKSNDTEMPNEDDYASPEQADPGITDSDSDLNAHQGDADIEKAEIDVGKAAVARDPKQSIAIGVVAFVLIGIGAYYFLFSGDDKAKKTDQNDFPIQKKEKKAQPITTPQLTGQGEITSAQAISPEAFKAPDDLLKDTSKSKKPEKAPELPSPPAPSLPATSEPVQPSQPVQLQIQTKSSTELAQRKNAKMKSSIMLSGGSGSNEGKDQSAGKDAKRNLSHTFQAEATSASSSKITKVGNMSLLITQGKILEAVLETPVNTNYPGPIRALVSRDVFSEQGENVLIPKGSRIIGELSGGYKAGQDRILIKWNRIIMPNGYDIMVEDARGAGKLGEIGVVGKVHREFFNTIGNALLLSAINIGFAAGIENAFKVKPTQETTTTTTDGAQTSTTTNSPVTQAAKDQVKDLQDATKGWVQKNFVTQPYITIDQGTVLKVFVNQDILFSNRTSSGVNIIQ